MDEPVTVGELFDPDDVVARWVFSLTAAVEDLSITQSLFKNALDADAPLHNTGALLRLLMVRMLEAERPIIATQHNDGVRAFLDEVPEAAEPLEFLRDMFLERPCTCSKVREAFGDVRHRTVHHSWVDSDELRSALVDAADEDARIIVSRSAGTLHFEWPEAVATRRSRLQRRRMPPRWATS